MLNAKEIKQLHTQQGKKLEGMRSIVQAVAKRKQGFSKTSGQFTQEEQLRHESLNNEDSNRAEQVLHNMRDIVDQLERERPYWTKEGYMMRSRSVPPITDGETLIGKNMTVMLSNLLDETIRIRIGNEASRMTEAQLKAQADDAAATDDYQTIRLLRLEAQSRTGNQAKDAYNHIDDLVIGLEIPDQEETLQLIDDAAALLDQARELWFGLQGGGYFNLNSMHQKSYGGKVAA